MKKYEHTPNIQAMIETFSKKKSAAAGTDLFSLFNSDANGYNLFEFNPPVNGITFTKWVVALWEPEYNLQLTKDQATYVGLDVQNQILANLTKAVSGFPQASVDNLEVGTLNTLFGAGNTFILRLVVYGISGNLANQYYLSTLFTVFVGGSIIQ